MTFKRLLILGGTGRAGQALVREALARGHEVTALARDPSVLEPLAHEQLRKRFKTKSFAPLRPRVPR